jgi:hypothetical protein
MKTRNLWLGSALALLSACGGSDHHGASMSGSNTPPPAPVDKSISTFVKQSFADTSDTAEPIDINDRTFTDDENENAYDDML